MNIPGYSAHVTAAGNSSGGTIPIVASRAENTINNNTAIQPFEWNMNMCVRVAEAGTTSKGHPGPRRLPARQHTVLELTNMCGRTFSSCRSSSTPNVIASHPLDEAVVVQAIAPMTVPGVLLMLSGCRGVEIVGRHSSRILMTILLQ